MSNAPYLTPLELKAPPGQPPPQQELLARQPGVLVQSGLSIPCPGEGERVLSLAVLNDLRQACMLQLEDESGVVYSLDAGFASHAQRLRLIIPSGVQHLHLRSAATEGELWIAATGPLQPTLCPTSVPRVQRRALAFDRLRHNALCQYSWMGGCVLDGMWQLHTAYPHQGWHEAIQQWQAYYFREGHLQYQCPKGSPLHDEFTNIESTLPVAVLAHLDPAHPAIDAAIALWKKLRGPDGVVQDDSITAEGCYTVAYPMAAVARSRGDEKLADEALLQLARRQQVLFHDGALYLRNKRGELSFRNNWTRGICWHVLGMARTLSMLGPERDAAAADTFTRMGQWIIEQQRPDGLWDNFLGEPGYPPDSSGSSGIATALLLGMKLGLLPESAQTSAQACWHRLEACLEPDGWLGSVAPNNKRGETEQHTLRRNVEPFALGLYGQLAAALAQADIPPNG